MKGENVSIRPARRPCGSCPYRCDVPSGVWDRTEYEKLPPYDLPTAQQPLSVFLCHQQDGRLCAGWVAVHDMEESLGLRLLSVEKEDYDTICEYTTDVPLFPSGAAAAAHGLARIVSPASEAARLISKLERRLR